MALAMAAAPPLPAAPVALDQATARQIAALINGYRRAHGLPPVALSPALTAVAEAHVADMGATTQPVRSRAGQPPCNLHSWAGTASRPLCYTGDERSSEGMEAKPGEVTHGRYASPAYEIAFWTSATPAPDAAVTGWERSPAHNAVILQQGMWQDAHWQAMGVAAGGHCAFVWFGEAPDREGAR